MVGKLNCSRENSENLPKGYFFALFKKEMSNEGFNNGNF